MAKQKEVYHLSDYRRLDPYDEMARLMKNTVYAVEANRHEQHELWLQHAREGSKYLVHVNPVSEQNYRGDWKQINTGWSPCIGTFNGGGNKKYSVHMSMNWSIINGHHVLFFFQCGRWCDHDMSRAWIGMHMPQLFPEGLDHAGRFTDAQNIHTCLHYIADLNKPKAAV